MIQHCPSGAGLLRPRIFCFYSKEGLYMFAAIDAFVTWFAKQPSVPFWVGYIGAMVFMRICDALKSPGVFDDSQEESEDSTDD